ncbi:hypothetical protein Tsubulata_016105 [Turnera subulata]|uniref:RING-type domain-containing protein n=1 Tax=Turnera subulata TaxID=218843 RepID=A0A9Q0J2Q6_9ROSI|nr:hypothetical protein Tsubulata_016105 [Turnera subulata]
MGQSLDSMTRNQSKEEVLYQLVTTGNIEAIKTLRREGATLEWIDKEGKTPLIIACMDSGLLPVAKTLIELGANINAYRPGRHAGTPLHHATKRGLEQTVRLLLSSGANAFVRNDDCLTALDVARIKGNTTVVRTIELIGCSWVVVIPCGTSNPSKPFRLELAIYPTLEDTQPRTVVSLWKAKIEEPKFNQSDPILTIFDQSTKTRYKFASATEGDKLQLRWICDACKGIPQVMPPADRHDSQTAMPVFQCPASGEPGSMTTAVSSVTSSENRPVGPNSGQSCEATTSNGWQNVSEGGSHNGWSPAIESKHSVASSSGWVDEVPKEDYKGWGGHAVLKEDYNGWGVRNSGPTSDQAPVQAHSNAAIVEQSSGTYASASSAPSAPPIPDGGWDEGPIHYPSIDFSPVNLAVSEVGHGASTSNVKDEVENSSSCIICWEAPVEGACIPCGHMAGCMACLTAIKAKKGVCPVCRTEIKQVVKLYAV